MPYVFQNPKHSLCPALAHCIYLASGLTVFGDCTATFIYPPCYIRHEGGLLWMDAVDASLSNFKASASPQSMLWTARIDCGDAEAVKLVRPAPATPFCNDLPS